MIWSAAETLTAQKYKSHLSHLCQTQLEPIFQRELIPLPFKIHDLRLLVYLGFLVITLNSPLHWKKNFFSNWENSSPPSLPKSMKNTRWLLLLSFLFLKCISQKLLLFVKPGSWAISGQTTFTTHFFHLIVFLPYKHSIKYFITYGVCAWQRS